MAPPLITTQPFRTIYKLFRFVALGVRAPIWLLKFTLIKSSRPDPRWTLRQTVMCRIMREVIDIASTTEAPITLSLKPGKDKDCFKVIEPAEATFYKGPLSSEEILPATIGGTWYPKPLEIEKPSDLDPDAHVVLHIHGGGFVIGTGRAHEAGFFATTLLKQATSVAAVFCPQYRLSCPPASAPFPAALQDVVTSYLYLVHTLGIPAKQIVISGDSAGGNLAVAFLRYLSEGFGAGIGTGAGGAGELVRIPSPGSAVLISPWVAPAAYVGSEAVARATRDPRYATDYLPASLAAWGARAYAGTGAETRTRTRTPVSDPYITALGHPFRTPDDVPVFVSVAPGELLEADITPWVAEMRAAAAQGNVVQVFYDEGAPHDTLFVGDVLGWTESAEAVAEKVGVFIRESARKGKGLD